MISNVGLSHVLYFPLTGGAILSHASFFCSSSFVTQSASSFLCFQYSIRKYNSIYIQKGAVKMMWHFRLQTWKWTPLMGHPCATHVLHDSVGSARTGRPVPGRPAGYCPSCDGCDEENRLACQDVSSSFISTRPPVNWPIWVISISWMMEKCGLFWPKKCTWAERRANPLPASGSFPPFPQDWETPVCRLRRGGHKCHKKSCNFPHNYDKI